MFATRNAAAGLYTNNRVGKNPVGAKRNRLYKQSKLNAQVNRTPVGVMKGGNKK